MSAGRKVVFVTGASRGIGAALVARFQEGGWRVACCARREPHAGDYAFACDVSDPAQVRVGVRGIVERLGRLDAVVNNAGVAGSDSMDADASDADWHRIMGVNLHGAYYVCKQAIPFLPDGAGRIVNVASVLGLRGVPDQVAYTASKHGLVGLTRSLAHLLAPRRITVNAVCPGWTRTAMAEGRARELGTSAESLASGVPIGRFAEPAEVAELVHYLCGEKAGALTGQALAIDGGSLA